MKSFIIFLFSTFFLIEISISQENSTVKKLEFCSPEYDEFAGDFYNNYLIFSGNLKNGTYMNFLNNYAIFKTKQDAEGKWSEPEIYDLDLLSNFNDGPIVFYDSVLYLTNFNKKPLEFAQKSNSESKSGIFYRKKTKGRWEGKNIAFSHNSASNFLAHPTFTPERKKIFFSANLSDAIGGTDLYYCILSGDKWSQPFNMGKLINTTGNEVFPFYHADGILYFSSDNHNSIGGLDIFYSEFKNNEWSKPVSMGTPVNSVKNDFAINVFQESDAGLFSSDREGSLDIFSYQSKYPHFINCYVSGDINRCVNIYEEGTEILDTNLMIFEWELGDGTNYYGNDFEYCYQNDGKFKITLNVTDKISGQKLQNVASTTITIKTDESLFFSIPSETKVSKEIIFEVKENNLKDFTNNIFYWDFGDGVIMTGESIKHVYANPGEYIVKLGVLKDTKNITESNKYCVYKKINVIK